MAAAESGLVSITDHATEEERKMMAMAKEMADAEEKRRTEAAAAKHAAAEAAARQDAAKQLQERRDAKKAVLATHTAIMEQRRKAEEDERARLYQSREAKNRLIALTNVSSLARTFISSQLAGWYKEAAATRLAGAGAGTGEDPGGDDMPSLEELATVMVTALDAYDDANRDPVEEARKFSQFFMDTLCGDSFDPPSSIIDAVINLGIPCAMFRFVLEKAGIHAVVSPMPSLSIDSDSSTLSGAVVTFSPRGGEAGDLGAARRHAADTRMFVCLPKGASDTCLSPGGVGGGVLDCVPSFTYLVKLNPLGGGAVPNMGDVNFLPSCVRRALTSLGASTNGDFNGYAVQIVSSASGEPYLFLASPPKGHRPSRAAMRKSLSEACSSFSRKVGMITKQTSTYISDVASMGLSDVVGELMLDDLPNTEQYKSAAQDAASAIKVLADAIAHSVGYQIFWDVDREIIRTKGNVFAPGVAPDTITFFSACVPVPKVVSSGVQRHVMFVRHDKPPIIFTGCSASTMATAPGVSDIPLALPMTNRSAVACLKEMEDVDSKEAARGAFAPQTCVVRLRDEPDMETAVYTHAAELDDATIKSFSDYSHGAPLLDSGSMTPKGALVVL